MKILLVAASMLGALITLSACSSDSGDVQGASQGYEENASVGNSDFDESILPGDFPRKLIPDSYSVASYNKMGGFEGATFEAERPVEDTIIHYIGVLGESAVSIDPGDGGRTAQWHTTPWAIAFMADGRNTIVSFSRAGT